MVIHPKHYRLYKKNVYHEQTELFLDNENLKSIKITIFG